MDDRVRPSLLIKIVAPLVFIFMAVGALLWFILEVVSAASVIINARDIVYINKGVLYMLGISVGLSSLSYVLVSEFWFGVILNEALNQLCTKLCIIGVVMMFIVPHLFDYTISYYLATKGYVVCEKASSQWLHSKTTAYAIDSEVCLALSNNDIEM